MKLSPYWWNLVCCCAANLCWNRWVLLWSWLIVIGQGTWSAS